MNLAGESSPQEDIVMERRYELRKQELLAQCQVEPKLLEGMVERLAKFAVPFLDYLPREKTKVHGQVYLAGLLSDVKKRNTETIAYRFGKNRMNLQRFIGWAPWDYRPLLMELARQVGMDMGESDGVIVFDPSGFPKKGKESVGVARQWIGRLGKVENGQVSVYMGYASRIGHALVDTRLYLPKEWAGNKARRKRCAVPREIRYHTRHELALEMLDEKGDLLPHGWIAGDDEMGRSTQFRRDLRAREERYVLAVPSNTNVRDLQARPPRYSGRGRKPKQPFERVDHWCGELPEDAWTRIDVRDGERGPLTLDIVTTRVVARTENRRTGSVEELLIVTRTSGDGGCVKHDYYLSNPSADTPLKELARVIKAEHRIEECIQRGKSEAGLADYEVRSWAGWHHHQTLSLIATWFLDQEARRGKKMDTGHHGPTGPRSTRHVVARGLWLRQPSTHRRGKDDSFGAK
jgi:SRSO17 transposase